MGTDAAQHHIALAVDIGGSKVEIAAIAAAGQARTETPGMLCRLTRMAWPTRTA